MGSVGSRGVDSSGLSEGESMGRMVVSLQNDVLS